MHCGGGGRALPHAFRRTVPISFPSDDTDIFHKTKSCSRLDALRCYGSPSPVCCFHCGFNLFSFPDSGPRLRLLRLIDVAYDFALLPALFNPASASASRHTCYELAPTLFPASRHTRYALSFLSPSQRTLRKRRPPSSPTPPSTASAQDLHTEYLLAPRRGPPA